MSYRRQAIEAWQLELSKPGFKRRSILSFALLALALVAYALFVAWVETRPGTVLDDPLLKFFHPVNLSWLTFLLIYAGLAVALAYMFHTPTALIQSMTAYSTLIGVRILSMWMLPLDPPSSMIPLTDPFVETFGGGATLTRDLFFSGHTATMFLISLVVPHPFLKRLFLGLTVAVGACVLLQHVHYAIDVLAAPFFSYGAFRISRLVWE